MGITLNTNVKTFNLKLASSTACYWAICITGGECKDNKVSQGWNCKYSKSYKAEMWYKEVQAKFLLVKDCSKGLLLDKHKQFVYVVGAP